MSIFLKVFLGFLLVVISVIPSFFTVIDSDKQGNFYNRLNASGWALVGLILITIVLSIIVEYNNNKESTNTKNILNDIQLAMKKNNLNYDPTHKTISSIMTNYGGNIGITAGPNSTIMGSIVADNRKGLFYLALKWIQ